MRIVFRSGKYSDICSRSTRRIASHSIKAALSSWRSSATSYIFKSSVLNGFYRSQK